MITKLVIYAFIAGSTLGIILPSAVAWTRDLRLKMTWWKWLLASIWWVLFLFIVLMNFTFIGEGEIGAGIKLLLVQLVVMVIFGVGLVRLLLRGRKT